MAWLGTLRNKLVGDRQKAFDQASPPEEPQANEKQYQDEIKAMHLRMGYGTITKEQHDQGIQDINKKYGRDQ